MPQSEIIPSDRHILFPATAPIMPFEKTQAHKLVFWKNLLFFLITGLSLASGRPVFGQTNTASGGATPYRTPEETSGTSIKFQTPRETTSSSGPTHSAEGSSIRLAGDQPSSNVSFESQAEALQPLASSFGSRSSTSPAPKKTSSASLTPVSTHAGERGSSVPAGHASNEDVIQPIYSKKNAFKGSLREGTSLPPTANQGNTRAPAVSSQPSISFPGQGQGGENPSSSGFSDMSPPNASSESNAPPSELPTSPPDGSLPAPLDASDAPRRERLAANPPRETASENEAPPASGPEDSPKETPREELPPLDFGEKESEEKSTFEHPMTGVGALVPVIGSLALVLGVFFALAMIMRRARPKGMAQLPKEVFENLGRAPLTSRLQLQLLRLGDRLILVAVSPDNVETICEVTHPDEVVHLLGLCRRQEANSSTGAFQQVLKQFAQEPVEGGYFGTETESVPPETSSPMSVSSDYLGRKGDI